MPVSVSQLLPSLSLRLCLPGMQHLGSRHAHGDRGAAHQLRQSRHVLPRIHVVVPRDKGFTESGMYHAVITVISRDLREAIAIRELARQTVVQVPTSIDTRGWRYASTWWVQQRGQDEARHAWQVSV